jgi:hypothetical protein
MDRMEFQRRIHETGHAGQIHTAKLASVIFDLVEEYCKANAPKGECLCKQLDVDTKMRELTDAYAGMIEGLKSFNMKIDDLENKIELLCKGSKKLKLKDD